jgi:hypothetical protein
VLFNEDVAYAEQLGAKMDQRGNEYSFASNELVKNDPQAQREIAAQAQSAPARPTAPRRTTPGTPPPAPPPAPPNSTVGVAQLTESNQLKRKALTDDVAQSKVAATTAFDLDAKISQVPPARALAS